MLEAMQHFFRKYRDWTLYAGFSGGADSLALLLLLRELQEVFPFRLTAVHCEHGLRGAESRADAAFCREICRKYGIAFELRELDVPGNRFPGESVEAAARRLRQKVWQELAGAREQTAVVLAHHAGDRRENLLLRLARGSGSAGLSGLRGERRLNGVLYLRPLLNMERAELECFLDAAGEHNTWRVDASNADTRYRRNFLRQDLLPLWKKADPALETGLDAALEALEKESALLERMGRFFARNVVRSDGGIAAWRSVPSALHGRVLRLLARGDLQMDWIPGRAFLSAFRRILKAGKGGALPMRGVPGVRWIFREDRGFFERFTPACPVRVMWRWREEALDGWQITFPAELPGKITLREAYFDAAFLPETLLVSTGENGDKMVPFGRRAPVKWKVLRIDRKIPRLAAPPLLRLPDGEILWSPLIRHSALAPVTENTEEIVCFQWMKGK